MVDVGLVGFKKVKRSPNQMKAILSTRHEAGLVVSTINPTGTLQNPNMAGQSTIYG